MEPLTVIWYADFAKVDIRVGTVTSAEPVTKSEKLLRLLVFFGADIGERQILAGIAKSYDPVSLVGRQVLGVVNLAPRTMMGLESHGMLLAADTAEGGVTLASCSGAVDGAQLG